MRWAGHVAYMEEMKNAYSISFGKPQGKRPRPRWEENIKMDGKDWTGCIWLRIGTSSRSMTD
jgi:hypothetical protein